MTTSSLDEGRKQRNKALTALEKIRVQYIEDARVCAEAHARAFGSVTADDVRRLCPVPDGVDARVVGAVFHSPVFEPHDFVSTERPTSHARPIRQFRIKEDR